MFTSFNMYKNLAIGAVIIAAVLYLWIYISSMKDEIVKLDSKLKDSYMEMASIKLESHRYKSSLDSQNKEIEALKAYETLALAKLKKWASKEPEVKYKTIYKTREVKSNECTDIKSVLDGVADIDYDLL